MKTKIIMMRNIFITLGAMLLVAGCSGSNSTSDNGTGSIAAKLAWSDAKSTAKTVALAPAGVTTVRIIISGSGMTTLQQDFPAASGTGSISGVLAGTGRTLTALGLNGSGAVTHQGSATNITVQPGQTSDAGNITMLPLNPPAAPSGLTASAISSSQINLSWTNNATDETGFKIERKTGAGGSYAQIHTVGANATTYSNTGLTAATAYFYRVRAYNGAGDSWYTNEANATTLASGGGGGTGTIQLPKTGQTVSYAAGDDGATQRGVAWPSPRFTDNSNGTVTDNLTGLIWLKNANCFSTQTWATALTSANTLASGVCGLTDSSMAGQWRLPNRKELQSLVDRSTYNPALPTGHPFTGVQSSIYWSSSSVIYDTGCAWYVRMIDGSADVDMFKTSKVYVWPVRAGE